MHGAPMNRPISYSCRMQNNSHSGPSKSIGVLNRRAASYLLFRLAWWSQWVDATLAWSLLAGVFCSTKHTQIRRGFTRREAAANNAKELGIPSVKHLTRL
jgi:hypothetical protein